MNNNEKKRNKIEEIKKKLFLTENDLQYIKDKMKEYYGEYVNDDNELYNDYNLLKNKINKNHRLNKSVSSGPRNIIKFKQDIYKKELRKIIDFLLINLESFPDFESIILFVAKRRRIIELLKLNLDKYLLFGEFRGTIKYSSKYNIFSPIINSKGDHLINNIISDFGKNKCVYKNNKLTYIRNIHRKGNVKHLSWKHTRPQLILKLFNEMNEIYEEFIESISNINNKETSKNLLSKLYWLYIQACPFLRGSASIGEIVFSALLQKHFDCDFRLFKKRFSPKLIPDIHALTYPLEHFQSIFWSQLVSCEQYKNNFNRNSNWNNYMNKRGPDF